MDRTFVGMVDTSNEAAFINLSLIRHVLLKWKDGSLSCEVLFAPDHRITVSGAGAQALMDRLMERGIAMNGDPLTSVDDITPPAVKQA